MNPPDDLVELGRILGAYGLRGWVSIAPESADPTVLRKVKKWWISRLPESVPKGGPAARAVKPEDLIFEDFAVLECKDHSGKLVAHLQGVESRDLAEQFKGRRIYVSRARFPSTTGDEYYWVDLVGCQVKNLEGVQLGVVAEVTDHGAHPILVLDADTALTRDPAEPQILIPFVKAYVTEVSVSDRQILVDWQADY